LTLPPVARRGGEERNEPVVGGGAHCIRGGPGGALHRGEHYP
jgi:hypothetical protein